MLLPPIDAMPNASMVAASRKESSGLSSQTAAPFHWRLPNTRIEIVEILEGERRGQFLFSASTVRSISDVCKKIKDLTKRDQRLMKTKLQLRYETTAEQLRYILMKIRELFPMVTPDPARVRFLDYADYSKDIEFFCYLRCREQNDFLAIQEDVLLRIEDIIKKAGSGFAFPSQTAYLTRDSGLDDKRREEAETEVGHRRFTGKLPFPEFDEEEWEQLEDILDYPPKGSPGYSSPRIC